MLQVRSITPVHANERFELEFLRKEVSRLSEELGVNDDDAGSVGSELVSDPDDEDDFVDELPAPIEKKANK